MNLSDVLSGLGMAGVVVTGVLSGRAGARLKEKEVNLLKIRSFDEFLDVLPDIAPPVISGGLTLLDIGLTKHIDRKTLAWVVAGGAGAAELHNKYKDKLKEIVGEERFNEIKAEISKEIGDRLPIKTQKFKKEQQIHKPKIRIPSDQTSAHAMTDERGIDWDEADDIKDFVLDLDYRRIRFQSNIAKVLKSEIEVIRYFDFDDIISVGTILDCFGLSEEIDHGDQLIGLSYESISDYLDGTDEPSLPIFNHYIWTDDAGNKVCTVSMDETPPRYLNELDKLYNGEQYFKED